ncbi:MAG: thiamine phosphate synthase [Selenomonadaceae bacterium]|nr:thiamine phosphate synthase [Selenomonadaceae bacterium]
MEKNVLSRREAIARFEESPVYVITDEGQSAGRGNLMVVRAALEAGAKFVQYREKKKALRAMYEEGLLLRKLTEEYGAALIVDDYVDLALIIGADGVHVGQDDLPAEEVRKLVGEDMVIGLSTHNPEDLAGAVELYKKGVIDYIGAGPVYPTQTKEKPAPVTGLDYIELAADTHAETGLPFVAIGGIKEHNIGAVAAVGAEHCAVVSDITMAEDIGAKIAALTAAMKKFALL